MKKWIVLSTALVCAVGVNASIVEDFETASVLGDTDIKITNTMAAELAAPPVDATGFGTQSLLLTKGTGTFSAFMVTLNNVSGGQNVDFSFDLYVADPAYVPGVVRYEWNTSSSDKANLTVNSAIIDSNPNMTRYSGTMVAPSLLSDGTTPVDSVRLFVNFNPGVPVSTADFGYLDNVVMIPEPATIGLVGAFGGAILFIRRRIIM